MLAGCGYNIHIFDPLGEEQARETLNKDNVHFYKTVEECLRRAEVVFMGLPIDVDKKLLVNKTVINPWLSKALYSSKSG
jgi:phosphoglycerate dehydrogenase-like enzyme